MDSSNLEKIVKQVSAKRKKVLYLGNRRPDKTTYERYSNLLKEDLSRIEISRQLGISRQAVTDYLQKHPELTEPEDSRKGADGNKYQKIKELVEKGKSVKEISDKMNYSNAQNASAYLRQHPELPKPKDIKKAQWKWLILKGRKLSQIEEEFGIKNPSSYLANHPELRELYHKIQKGNNGGLVNRI